MVDPFCFAFIWFRVQGSGFRVLVAASPPFFIGAMPSVSFLPWDFIRVSLAFSSIVVYNKSSECHCFFWRGILIF